jgi:signal transduction histidine kinase/response regulator of citrate/malate metabolism
MNAPSKKYLNLRSKLIIGMIIYNVIWVFGVPLIYYGYFFPKAEAKLEILINAMEKMASFRLQDLLGPIDKESIEVALPRIIIVPELKYLGVYGPDNTLIAEKFEDEKIIEFPKEVIYPVIKDGKTLGSFKMIFTEKFVREEIQNGILRAYIFFLVNTILGYAILIYFLRFVITQQLEDINNFIKSFDSNSTTFPDILVLNKKRLWRDEFDLVTEELNKLVIKVVKHNRDEHDRYNVIESEVYKRTDALLQAKQKADKAAQEKIEFIGVISHEIRNPINAILGFSELLEKEIKDSDKVELIRPIVDSSSTLLTLVNDLLDISKVEMGKLKIEMIPAKIHDFIKSIERIYRPKIEGKGISFHSVMDENFPKFLKIDPLRLSQVISNLLENSLKFTKDGFIKVTYNHSPSKNQNKVNIKIAIEDTGMGIPKEDWPFIFEKFRQPKGQSYQKFKGSGIGLSVCKKIAQLMGGDINIVEKGGAGTLFVIDLPDLTEALPSDFKSETIQTEYVFEKSKVLVVEDEKLNQDLIKWNLKAFPIELFFANNGKEGINMALMHKPDLILMDILMPNMDGIEAVELIRVYENLKKTPIIVITGILGPEVEKKISHLVNGMLRKPILQRDLFPELAKFLPHKIKKISKEPEEASPEEMIPSTTKKKMGELFLTRLDDLMDTMSIQEGQKLAEEISVFAKNNNQKSIMTWSKNFKDSLNEFDIKKIKSLISEIKIKILA